MAKTKFTSTSRNLIVPPSTANQESTSTALFEDEAEVFADEEEVFKDEAIFEDMAARFFETEEVTIFLALHLLLQDHR